jgi:hypothetical protein
MKGMLNLTPLPPRISTSNNRKERKSAKQKEKKKKHFWINLVLI